MQIEISELVPIRCIHLSNASLLLVDSYMNFDANFLRNYIEEEMEIYEKVFPKWEQCDEKFTKLGSALNYTEFEQASGILPQR